MSVAKLMSSSRQHFVCSTHTQTRRFSVCLPRLPASQILFDIFVFHSFMFNIKIKLDRTGSLGISKIKIHKITKFFHNNSMALVGNVHGQGFCLFRRFVYEIKISDFVGQITGDLNCWVILHKLAKLCRGCNFGTCTRIPRPGDSSVSWWLR